MHHHHQPHYSACVHVHCSSGEWSIGKILDIYFQFAMGGDYYLGRLLILIDPEDEMFASLPPHDDTLIDSTAQLSPEQCLQCPYTG